MRKWRKLKIIFSIFFSGSHHDDDSENSDLDDELDFENPLDSITLRLPGSNSIGQSPNHQSIGGGLMPPPIKKLKRDSTETKTIPMPTLTAKDIKLHKIPNLVPNPAKIDCVKSATPPAMPLTVPGLKPGEFLIPTGSAKPGQKQQFLVVKRLPEGVSAAASGTSNAAGLKIERATPSVPLRNPPAQIKIAPPSSSPSQSQFVISNTPPPPQNVPPKAIPISLPSIQSSPVDQSKFQSILKINIWLIQF